jgi:hypothetical protein
MLDEDQQQHEIEMGAECAGVVAAALAAERQKFEDKDQQFIRPTGMQTAQSAQGEPMLIMKLEGGVELPLVFRTQALGVLISELEKLKAILEPGSQIRWQ